MQNNREIKAPADEIKLELKTARPTMRLNEQAFRRPPENPDDEKKRQAYLDTVYGDKLAKRDVKKDYEEMVLALCRALHETIGKKKPGRRRTHFGACQSRQP